MHLELIAVSDISQTRTVLYVITYMKDLKKKRERERMRELNDGHQGMGGRELKMFAGTNLLQVVNKPW